MGAFGERMQRERELRGVTLDEISVVTKIGTRSLKALEEEDFDKLPGGIFNKGFVRAYARYLGIDPDEAVADYLAAVEGRNRAVDPPAMAPIPVSEPVPQFETVEEPESSYSGLVFAGIILVLAIAAGSWWILSGRGPSLDSLKKLVQSASNSETQKQNTVETNTGAAQRTETPPLPAPVPVQGRAPVLAEVNPAILSPAAKAADERAAKAAAEKT
ncbi:MAG TPA: helix-turn-helix domain-containing protein, partial [Terriglobales bacterium]|nr:helix-turn-helix domain-containing protein [Terriglobales bacterium]